MADKGKEVCKKCNGSGKVKKTWIKENANCEEMEVEGYLPCPDCTGKPEAGKEVKTEGMDEAERKELCYFCDSTCSDKTIEELGECGLQKFVERLLASQRAELLKEIVERLPKEKEIKYPANVDDLGDIYQSMFILSPVSP